MQSKDTSRDNDLRLNSRVLESEGLPFAPLLVFAPLRDKSFRGSVALLLNESKKPHTKQIHQAFRNIVCAFLQRCTEVAALLSECGL
jgi:hypothetical protein